MNVTYSEYLLSRRFNRKLYEKVKGAIEQLDFDAYAKFDMSAKTQSPVIHVYGPQSGDAADEVYSILYEHFQVTEPCYVDENRTDVEFRDEY